MTQPAWVARALDLIAEQGHAKVSLLVLDQKSAAPAPTPSTVTLELLCCDQCSSLISLRHIVYSIATTCWAI
jgi:hypothetical protein